jgi:hypothetical protein
MHMRATVPDAAGDPASGAHLSKLASRPLDTAMRNVEKSEVA